MFNEIVGIILDHLGPKVTGEEAQVLAEEILDRILRELEWMFAD